jgi:hypothetical protein
MDYIAETHTAKETKRYRKKDPPDLADNPKPQLAAARVAALARSDLAEYETL